MPGGVSSPVRAWKSVKGEPVYIVRGEGSKVIDADGNVYIDYVCSWGPLILGHADHDVVRNIYQTAKAGTSFGAPSVLEIELAEKIINALPSIEMLRFVNSGTEATMSAIRLARAYTKRQKIIKFSGGYHGHADFLLAKAGSGIMTLSNPASAKAMAGKPDSAGVPKQITATTLVATYNDLDSVEKLFYQYKNDIAAIIVEPVAGNMGVVVPQKSFLQGLRKITQKYKALLIFDEVITGFRVAWGGAQELYGIDPDITCLGKIIGGGLPVGAYGGKKEIMELIAPLGPVYQAGTLSGNPVTMAAGITTLEKLQKNKNAYRYLDSLASQLEQGLLQAARKANIKIVINRVGSMMTIFFTDNPVTDYESAKKSDTQKFAEFFHGMIEKGIYLPPSQFEAFFVSLSHTEEAIQETVKSAEIVFQNIDAKHIL